jgi:hypothetical protein
VLAAAAWDAFPERERPLAREGTIFFLRKTVLASRNRHKNETILAPTAINENEFFLAKKYLG